MQKIFVLTLAMLSAFSLIDIAQAQPSAQVAPTAVQTPVVAPVTAPAVTQTASPPASNSQQNRMKECSAQYRAQNIPKTQHQAFMSNCLKKSPAQAAAPVPAPAVAATAAPSAQPVSVSQKDKMKSCNRDAKSQSLSGDSRKTFMKGCLSK